MPLHRVRNAAPGPRFLNLAGGEQRVLQPGEEADLDLLVSPEQDPALKGRIDAGELVFGAASKPLPGAADAVADPATLHEAEAELAALQERVARLRAVHTAAALDTARRTPPRQFGGDGGPEQLPTVDGEPGAPTPAQGEGTAEQRAAGKAPAAPAAPAKKA